MTFKAHIYQGAKPQIRTLLRARHKVQQKIRYCKEKIKLNKMRIKILETETLVAVEKKLNFYLKEKRD